MPGFLATVLRSRGTEVGAFIAGLGAPPAGLGFFAGPPPAAPSGSYPRAAGAS